MPVSLKSHIFGNDFTLQGSTKTKEELKSLEKQIAERHKKHREDKKGSGEIVVYGLHSVLFSDLFITVFRIIESGFFVNPDLDPGF